MCYDDAIQWINFQIGHMLIMANMNCKYSRLIVKESTVNSAMVTKMSGPGIKMAHIHTILPSTKQLLKNVINFSAGYFGLNARNKTYSRHSLVSNISKKYDICHHQLQHKKLMLSSFFTKRALDNRLIVDRLVEGLVH